MSAEQNYHWRLEKWFPQLSKDTLDRLHIYMELLVKHNPKMNLVSSRSLPHADLVHFADSLLAFEPVYKNINKNEPLFDIASGAGFPGLVIGIAYPDVKVNLIEGDLKKCEFLRAAVAATQATNVNVVPLPIENLEEDSIEQGICRGYTTLSKAFLALRRPFRTDGKMYFMKSSEWAQEISVVPTQLCSIWAPSLSHEYKLPTIDSIFYVVVAVKNEKPHLEPEN
jgi:16S rRNA (guanine527-N7)-methyltransferase